MQISPSTLSTNNLTISTNPNQSELPRSFPTNTSNNNIRKPSFVSSVPIPTCSSSASASSSSSNSSSTGVSTSASAASVAAQDINFRYKVSGQMPDEQATAIVTAGKSTVMNSSTIANPNLLSTQTAPLLSANDEQLAQTTVLPLPENKETFALLSQTMLQVSDVITTIIILLRTICIIIYYVPICKIIRRK